MRNGSLVLTIFTILILFNARSASGQDLPSLAVQEYIRSYAPLAIREMKRTGVPASITLAQGILETEAGKSDLVIRSNNHFGIKCKSTWMGDRVYHDDDERGECFRKYKDVEESYRDHSDYLRSQDRYASLFRLDPEDYPRWAWGLKSAGYATNPKYALTLIRYIEDYDLQSYSRFALGKSKELPGMDPEASSNYAAGRTISDKPSERGKDDSISVQIPVGAPPNPGPLTYPTDEFLINETRVVLARSGTSLLSIAGKYNIRMSWLLDFNDLPPGIDMLDEDQLVFLKRKRRKGQHEFHVMKSGETVHGISQSEGLRLKDLLDYNHLVEGMLPAEGEKLYLQGKAPKRPALVKGGN